MLKCVRNNLPFIVFFILLVILPSLLLNLFLYDGVVMVVIRSAYFLMLFTLISALTVYLENKRKIIRIHLAIVLLIYYVLTFLFGFYVVFARTPFNIFTNLEIGFISITHGVVGILGYLNIVIIVFISFGVLFFTAKYFKKSILFLEKWEITPRKILGLFIIAIVLLILHGDIVVSSLITSYTNYSAKDDQIVFFPDNNGFKTNSNENIFILQLDSLNSLIVDENFTPQLINISKDGVLFPQFYGNSIRTNRAQDNILCGLNGNLKTPYSHHPADVLNKCLPQIFNDSNYITLFFRSDALEFTNTGNFMKEIGFQEIHHDDIMKEEDKKYYWGYDDTIFYKRIFEYLNEYYKDANNLFVYIEVSSHHYPFAEKEEYGKLVFDDAEDTTYMPGIDKTIGVETFYKRYINSAYIQDLALETFYTLFKEYDNNNAHLFIMGDHSWPIGIHKNINNEKGYYEDNFLTSMVYIPKKDSEYLKGKIVKQRFSEVDLIPTIFSILNKKEYKNSFESALRGKKPKKYDNCQLLVQPHLDLSYSTVKYPDKYSFLFEEKEIRYFNLQDDPYEQNEVILEKDANALYFLHKYGCDRYKDYNDYTILWGDNYLTNTD